MLPGHYAAVKVRKELYVTERGRKLLLVARQSIEVSLALADRMEAA